MRIDIEKLSGDFSRLKKVMRFTAFASKAAKLLAAAVLIFTAVDTFTSLKKA